MDSLSKQIPLFKMSMLFITFNAVNERSIGSEQILTLTFLSFVCFIYLLLFLLWLNFISFFFPFRFSVIFVIWTTPCHMPLELVLFLMFWRILTMFILFLVSFLINLHTYWWWSRWTDIEFFSAYSFPWLYNYAIFSVLWILKFCCCLTLTNIKQIQSVFIINMVLLSRTANLMFFCVISFQLKL